MTTETKEPQEPKPDLTPLERVEALGLTVRKERERERTFESGYLAVCHYQGILFGIETLLRELHEAMVAQEGPDEAPRTV